MHVNFITLKWGDKYGPEYVNRLYLSLLNLYSGPFTFYCYSDNFEQLHRGIARRDIDTLRKYPIDIFTNEKIYLFENFPGNNVLLDIDILITKDLYPYLSSYQFEQPRFVINHKPKLDYVMYSKGFRNIGANYINSSFVTWKDDQLKFIVDFYHNNKQVLDYKYKDLDTMLFHTIEDQLHFHPSNICYSYNSYKELLDYPIILFNNSQGFGSDLHNLQQPYKSMWEQWDLKDC